MKLCACGRTAKKGYRQCCTYCEGKGFFHTVFCDRRKMRILLVRDTLTQMTERLRGT